MVDDAALIALAASLAGTIGLLVRQRRRASREESDPPNEGSGIDGRVLHLERRMNTVEATASGHAALIAGLQERAKEDREQRERQHAQVMDRFDRLTKAVWGRTGTRQGEGEED